DVRRVLEESPDPFTPASWEKRCALAHFEPKGALISRGLERDERRRFNEDVLEHHCPMHTLAAHFAAIVAQEAHQLLAEIDRTDGVMTWEMFKAAWFRAVRQAVFGSEARDDTELIDMIEKLRSAGNFAFLHPTRTHLRDRFHDRVRQHLERAEPGSLAEVMARTPQNDHTAPEQQVPQWLFAFDPAAMTTFRALALLSTHTEQQERAREEIRSHEPATQPLPFLRATILESLRLWPTTPLVLRESTRDTRWEAGIMPAGTGIIIYAPFFHRDTARLDEADRFAPEIWEGEDPAADHWPLIPFSAGPAICPGRHMVLLMTSAMLANLLRDRDVSMVDPQRVDPNKPMPGILNNYTLRFRISARPSPQGSRTPMQEGEPA
ncbi:MAG: cytochrome P450, partial [Phycisphaerales bacterium]